MNNYKELKEFVSPVIDKIVDGSENLNCEEERIDSEGFELRVIDKETNREGRLVLNKKDNGRPVPIITINAISSKEENLFYEDHRVNNDSRITNALEEATYALLDNLDQTEG